MALVAALALAKGPLTSSREPRHPSPTTLRSLYGLAPPDSVPAPRTALVLVDFQREFFDGGLPLPRAADAAFAARQLLDFARSHGITVVHVQNWIANRDARLFAAGSARARIIEQLSPRAGEHVVTKATGGAFTRTSLDTWLKERGIDRLFVAGLMTHLAVQITATDAAALGYQVVVVADATATRELPQSGGRGLVAESDVQRTALATISDRAADVMSLKEVTMLPITGLQSTESRVTVTPVIRRQPAE